MRLIIREYLSMLKETDELEVIVPDLLNSMNIDVVAGAQSGVRQEGVDIHGIGNDPETGLKTNFLITVKRGNITRNIWSSDKQSVRQSLEEIIDVYITQKMTDEQLKHPCKIILCYGGEMKQEVQSNWVGFTKKYSEYSFDDWSGNKLSGLIELNLTDENLFFEDIKKDMRRTIVFLSDTDYKLNHYIDMLDKLLAVKNWQQKEKKKREKDALKVLNMISLCMGMIHQYSLESENLEHTINASELSLLKTWSFLVENDLHETKKILNKYHQLHRNYSKHIADYYTKLEKFYFYRDGICRQGRDSITSSIVTFKQIGILGTFGLNQALYALATEDKQGIENSHIISKALINLIENNKVSGSPCYDGQTIDICLAIYFLSLTGKIDEIKKWINSLVHRFHFSYNILGKGFPISYDSLDTLLEFEFEEEHSKEKMANMSTLVPTLAYWCAILDFDEEYKDILKLVEDLKETCLQLWYPEVGIKRYLYTEYAANKSGIAEAPLYLPESLGELKNRIKDFITFAEKNEKFETTWNDAPPAMALMASRQYRTPVVPFFWLSLINANVTSEKQAD